MINKVKRWKELSNEASRLKLQGKNETALQLMHKSIKYAKGANPVDVSLLYNKLANLCLICNRHEDAKTAAEKSLSIELEHGDCGLETTRIADFYIMLSRVAEAQSRYRDAANYIKKALPVLEDLLGPDNTLVNGVKNHLAELEDNGWRDCGS